MDAIVGEEAQLGYLRDAVDRRLAGLIERPSGAPQRLHEAMSYALLAPGKRVRPLLTLLSASHLGGDAETALEAACAVEMVHAASLVLDDLPCMDDSDVRRGRPATHVRHGEAVAVLTAVALLNHAFGVLSGIAGVPAEARLRMVRVLSDAVGLDGLAGGQDGDLLRDPDPSLARISDIHHRKTGVLFVAAAELGALSAGAGRRETEALKSFAAEIGLAFQALDDIADGGSSDAASPDAGRATVLSILGSNGARDEAGRRVEAAKAALRRGGRNLEPLGRYADLILGLTP